MDDLISRAAAIARIDKCVALSGIGPEPVIAVRDIKALISVLPAVDAVPVRHGRWIMDGQGFNCSACSEWVDSEIYYMLSPRQEPKCCPYCGAKMED